MTEPVVPTPHAPYGPLPTGGTVRPMARWGEPILHRALRTVTVFDDALRQLAADMVATMYAADGVGLAACQIGEDAAMFVFDCTDENDETWVGVVCNPVISVPEDAEAVWDDNLEGCLSLPGAFVELDRPDHARVDGLGLNGEPVSFEGSGLLARCLQHETDHIYGTIFGDHLDDKSRRRLFKEHRKFAKKYPPHWPAQAL